MFNKKLYMGYNRDKFKSLGKKSSFLSNPDKSILDKKPNPHSNTKYCVRFTCPEFTSICPVTSQPDFAKLIIDYVPNKFIVESKSFKLYLTGYRNHGAFHEDCTISIANDLKNLLKPYWLRIAGIWYPRGGIPIDVFWQTAKEPRDLFIPVLNTSPYRGRD